MYDQALTPEQLDQVRRENLSANVLANDTDADGDPLSAVLVSGPSHGTLSLGSGGGFTYTPTPGYTGIDSFTYRASDGAAQSNLATVNITVTPSGSSGAPTATDDTYTLEEDAPLTVPTPGVLANDSDPQNDSLTAVLVTDPSHGTLRLNSNGSFTYVPDLNYNGPDRFTYKASDGTNVGNTVSVSLMINSSPDGPTAQDDTYIVAEGTTLTVPQASGTPASDQQSLLGGYQFNAGLNIDWQQQVAAGMGGVLTSIDIWIGPNSTPGASFDFYVNRGPAWQSDLADYTTRVTVASGRIDQWVTVDLSSGHFFLEPGETFTFGARNGSGGNAFLIGSSTDHVGDSYPGGQLWRDGVIQPGSGSDGYDLKFRTRMEALTLPSLLANDTDPEGDPLSALLVSPPAHGTLMLNPDGGFTYTPNAYFHGSDNFTYKANDGAIDSTPATVNITVVSDGVPTPLQIASFDAIASGFTATFDRPFDPSSLNLYAAGTLGPTDLTVTRDGIPVRGTLVVAADNQALTFVATGGPLAPGVYGVSLRTGIDSFHAADDAAPLESSATSHTFTVASSSARVLRLPDFARGAGQDVNIPHPTTGIPLRLNDGDGLTSLTATLDYDPALLTINGITTDLPGASATVDTSTPGLARITVTTPTALAAGPIELARLLATVPTSAPYGAKQVLDLGDVVVNGGTIAAVADDAVQVAAFAGDVDGSTTINSVDSLFILQYVTNVRDGFTAYPTADPAILGDVDGGGSINSVDSLFILQYVTNVDPGLSRVPPRPSGLAPLSGGPDPKLSLPRDLSAAPGDTLSVPLTLEQTDPTTIALTSFDLVIAFDPSVFTVSGARLGGLSAGFTLLPVVIDATAGVVRIHGLRSTPLSLAPGTVGTLAELELVVRPDACSGVSSLNLLAVTSTPRGPVFTGLNGGTLSLVPAPTNAADDPIDGRVMIGETTPVVSLAVGLPRQGQHAVRSDRLRGRLADRLVTPWAEASHPVSLFRGTASRRLSGREFLRDRRP